INPCRAVTLKVQMSRRSITFSPANIPYLLTRAFFSERHGVCIRTFALTRPRSFTTASSTQKRDLKGKLSMGQDRYAAPACATYPLNMKAIRFALLKRQRPLAELSTVFWTAKQRGSIRTGRKGQSRWMTFLLSRPTSLRFLKFSKGCPELESEQWISSRDRKLQSQSIQWQHQATLTHRAAWSSSTASTVSTSQPLVPNASQS